MSSRQPYRDELPQAVPRTCLKCGKVFKSRRPRRVNRICPQCTQSNTSDGRGLQPVPMPPKRDGRPPGSANA